MSLYRRRKPDPDRILCAQLSGLAMRLGEAGGSVDDAVVEVRELANGRGDLLAKEAGLSIGFASVRPVMEAKRLAARLLVLAGADVDALPGWVEIGRQRASAPMHRA